jgi:hypothetical protein
MGLLVVTPYDEISDFFKSIRRVQNLSGVDGFNINIYLVVTVFPIPAKILDTKTKNVLVTDGIGNDIFMQTLTKQVFGRALVQRLQIPQGLYPESKASCLLEKPCTHFLQS